MQKAFNDIRNYARQEGGIDVGTKKVTSHTYQGL